jgi:hypothetical protein
MLAGHGKHEYSAVLPNQQLELRLKLGGSQFKAILGK